MIDTPMRLAVREPKQIEVSDPTQLLPAAARLRAKEGREIALRFPLGCEVRWAKYFDTRRGKPGNGLLAFFPEDVTTDDWSIDRQGCLRSSAFGRMCWRAPSCRHRSCSADDPYAWLPHGRTRVVLIGSRP